MTVEAVQLPLKDSALNAQRIARIAEEVHAVVPGFDSAAFSTAVTADLPRLELKARIDRTARALYEYLPITGPAALQALVRSLPSSPEAAGVNNDFGLHIYSPHSRYVALYHCNDAELDQALKALASFTRYFSAEDAARTFLNTYPDQTLAAARTWAKSGDYRVRRLASESTRPSLPWSARTTLPVGCQKSRTRAELGVRRTSVIFVRRCCGTRGSVRRGRHSAGCAARGRG